MQIHQTKNELNAKSDENKLYKKLNYLGSNLIEEIHQSSVIKTFPANTQLVREGQYVTLPQ